MSKKICLNRMKNLNKNCFKVLIAMLECFYRKGLVWDVYV